jgi:phosphoribosylanthranilate isomerase
VSGSVRIKFCGVLTVEDALAAVDAGADLVGINFVEGSPRRVDIRVAEEISEALSSTEVERVALFQDPSWDDVEHVLRRVEFERVQFHGDESEEDVETVDLPVIKAIRGADIEAANAYPGALLLLDHPSEGGGQGQAWNWSEAAEIISLGYDVILAGGLNADNVGAALHAVGDIAPWGVDVATGVEGPNFKKDPERMRAFVAAVREAEDEALASEDSES